MLSCVAGTVTEEFGLNSDVSTAGNANGCCIFCVSGSLTKGDLTSGFVGAPFFRGILCKYPNPISQPVHEM